MRVVLDGVFNHTGRGFWAFHHVLENGAGSPYRDWFHFSRAALDGHRPFRPYPWPSDPLDAVDEPFVGIPDDQRGDESFRTLGYRAWWGLPALPKLNTDNPEVRDHIFEVAEHWLRFGIDGWRLDVPTEIRDEAFWQEFRRRCRAVNPDAYIVGEIWTECPEWLTGDRFDAVMNYPLAEAIVGFTAQGHLDEDVVRRHHQYGRTVRRRDGAAFGAELERLMDLYDRAVTEVQLNLLDSHDSPRFRTMAGRDRAAYHLAVLLQATLPGAPCTYYGDEIGVEGDHDPDCRRAFPWDEARWDRAGLEWTRASFAARHALPALRRGTFRVVGRRGRRAGLRARGGGRRRRGAGRRQRGRRGRRGAGPGPGAGRRDARGSSPPVRLRRRDRRGRRRQRRGRRRTAHGSDPPLARLNPRIRGARAAYPRP